MIFTIKRATEEDAAAYCDIYNNTPEPGSDDLITPMTVSRAARDIRRASFEHVGIAMKGHKAIGLVHAGDGEVSLLLVKPKYQRQGVGTALMKWALAEMSDEEEDFQVSVIPVNENALAFYEKLGFKPFELVLVKEN